MYLGGVYASPMYHGRYPSWCIYPGIPPWVHLCPPVLAAVHLPGTPLSPSGRVRAGWCITNS